MRLILVEKLKEVMIFFEKTILKIFFLNVLFHLGYFNQEDRLFSPDSDFQHRPVQATMFKMPLPWDFLRIHRDVPAESQNFPFP